MKRRKMGERTKEWRREMKKEENKCKCKHKNLLNRDNTSIETSTGHKKTECCVW